MYWNVIWVDKVFLRVDKEHNGVLGLENCNIYLVRSPSDLVGENLAGYGWRQVDFSDASSFDELMGAFSAKGIDPGRHRNQMKRFLAISEGDIVVVPLYRAVAIGFATGIRSYRTGVEYGENRVGVEYLRNEDGSVVRIPRSELPEALSTRLRIRMSVVSLNEFREDILRMVDQVCSGGGTSFNSHIEALEADALDTLRKRLLANIRNGQTNLQSGGIGLENLVAELLRLEGYSARVLSKSAFEGGADADVEAFRGDRFSSNKLLIQVKHHNGMTGRQALQQLKLLDSDDGVQRWIITTGGVSAELVEEAQSDGIGVMDGETFTEWLVDHAHDLSFATLNKLGLSKLPSLLL
ncbi:restriction endonuclease [Motiliproteus sp. SC1-56]|uniref:restriction endonuclease n=1 Tax=Motiliproteus sp. SC1-56 TaxID=2799565 RepID=UPI001A8FD474|nr:restriction endonuclease [Motiliproteus sp. SC1-56]